MIDWFKRYGKVFVFLGVIQTIIWIIGLIMEMPQSLFLALGIFMFGASLPYLLDKIHSWFKKPLPPPMDDEAKQKRDELKKEIDSYMFVDKLLKEGNR